MYSILVGGWTRWRYSTDVLAGSAWQVCGVHKPGGSCASGEQLNECLQLCQQHAERLLETLEAAAAQSRSGDVA